MDKDLLCAARRNLRIVDVALRESRCRLAEGFEPKYEHPEMDIQFLQRTARSEILEAEDGDHGGHRLFRAFVELGVRWVRRPPKPRGRKGAKVETADTAKSEPDVLARIEATFIAEYEVIKPTEKSALDEFAIYNVPFNVWPFWREYVANQCNRMNLPKLTMPLQGFRSSMKLNEPKPGAGEPGQ